MVPQNLEKLFQYNSYDFYAAEEKGFTHKELAHKNHLYEEFEIDGIEYSSSFEDIYKNEYCSDKIISQIWIFRDENPIGLCLGIHHDNPVKISSQKYELGSDILGYIQLYIQEEHRGKGLASKCIPLLETMLKKNTNYPASFIMQDDAFPFGKYLQEGCAISKSRNEGNNEQNKKQLDSFYKNIIEDEIALEKYKKKYPKLKEEIAAYIEKETQVSIIKRNLRKSS